MGHSKSRLVESRSEDPDLSGDARRVGTGAVRNRIYPDNKFTSPDLSGCSTSRHLPRCIGDLSGGSKPRGESVYLFLEFTIVYSFIEPNSDPSHQFVKIPVRKPLSPTQYIFSGAAPVSSLG